MKHITKVIYVTATTAKEAQATINNAIRTETLGIEGIKCLKVKTKTYRHKIAKDDIDTLYTATLTFGKKL
jgi:hypothetical protein